MVHENTNYIVKVAQHSDGYEIINKSTGVVEGNVAHLPGAIMQANTYDEYLTKMDREAKHNEVNIVAIRKVDPQ